VGYYGFAVGEKVMARKYFKKSTLGNRESYDLTSMTVIYNCASTWGYDNGFEYKTDGSNMTFDFVSNSRITLNEVKIHPNQFAENFITKLSSNSEITGISHHQVSSI